MTPTPRATRTATAAEPSPTPVHRRDPRKPRTAADVARENRLEDERDLGRLLAVVRSTKASCDRGRNYTTGENVIWYMDGLTVIGGGNFSSAPTTWSIVGVGDFNGDGRPDIIWRNTVTGEDAIWYMDGTSVIGGGAFGSAPLSWSIVGPR